MFTRNLDAIYLPPAADVPAALRKAAGEHDKLVAAAAAAATEHRRAEQALPQAAADDEAVLARALRAGKPDPGTPATDKARKAVEQAKRHAGAGQLAAEGAADDLKAAIIDQRGAWLAQLEADQADRREDLAAALAQLDAARAALVAADETAGWLRQFPTRKGPRGGVPPVRALTGVNGSPVQWAKVLDALHAEAATPDAAPAAEPVPAA